MDAVNAFNMELFSMIDMKPPISRAKMMSVTKSAIKAIKLYKHVVQIVEKFIKKCKPELKVPGLYVVDSIVRQSRHQFGVDKDVFGPRFLKNFTDTFQNLYRCPEDDKSKIIRVLNLWQKNGVFEMSIIQPLMDMSNGAITPSPELEAPADPQREAQLPVTGAPAVPQLPTPDALAAVAQLFQSPHGQELHRMLQNFQQADKTLAASLANNIPNQPQKLVSQLNPYSAHTEKRSSLAEKLLDRFDYDDEPEEMTTKEGSAQSHGIPENVFNQCPGRMPNMENVHPHMMGQSGGIERAGGMSHGEHHMMTDGYGSMNEAYSQLQGNSREDSTMRREGRHRGYGRRSRSRSGSRSPRRRRSRSSSRSRRSRHRRSDSRSREQRWRSRSGSQDTNEREKDRERRQKGLPSMKSQTLSVCSTTLWVGQLDKKTQQSDVMSLLEEFGQIDSINMIPPRGCAYIVMIHRQDAYTALNKLSKGSYKVNQKPVKIAWALNKGIKSTHKKFWDVERGVTYIPWSKVKVEELDVYREGGMLDAETLNPEWNNGMELGMQASVNGALESVPAEGAVTAHVQDGVSCHPSPPKEERSSREEKVAEEEKKMARKRYMAKQCQMPPVQRAAPIGSPPAFPGSILLSPTSMPPRGAAFISTEFDPTERCSVKHPEDSIQDSIGDTGMPLDMCADHQLGSPTAPVMTLPGTGVMQGSRLGMPPLQPPPNMPNPHLPPFLSPPNMSHNHPQMMPGRPVFSPERFRMPMPFPPRGPPFHRHLSMGPDGMHDREGMHFRNGRAGFGCPPFQRGRW